ncbi:MAG TPA: phage holin family protein [Lacunisphaera sp.]
MNESVTGNSPLTSLFSELRSESTALLRQEVALAKAELAQKANTAARTSMKIAEGGALAYAGLIVLLIGAGQLGSVGLAALGVSDAIATWLGMVLVGALAGAVGWARLKKAKIKFQAENFDLPQTVGSLKDDGRWMKNKVQHAGQ